MRYVIDTTENREESIQDLIREYFTVKSEDPKSFDPSALHYYSSRPIGGRSTRGELSEDALVNRLDATFPVFVTCGENGETVAFIERGQELLSGQELADTILQEDREHPEHLSPERPKKVAAPGSLDNIMFRMFHYRTAKLKNYEKNEAAKDRYQQEIDREQSRLVSLKINDDALGTEIEKRHRMKNTGMQAAFR